MWFTTVYGSIIATALLIGLLTVPEPAESSKRPQIPQSETMNQKLTVNLNVSPKQIKINQILPSNLLQHIDEWPEKFARFLYQQRFFIAGGSILAAYLWLCRSCVNGNKYLEQTDTWAAWHQELVLEELLAMPQHELAKDLVVEIQRRYSNPKNPTDFLSPLISFMREIDREIALTQYYIKLYMILQRTHANAILPVNTTRFATICDVQRRLAYLRNVFLTWAAEYKVNHNRYRRRPMPPFSVGQISSIEKYKM